MYEWKCECSIVVTFGLLAGNVVDLKLCVCFHSQEWALELFLYLVACWAAGLLKLCAVLALAGRKVNDRYGCSGRRALQNDNDRRT